MGKYTIKDIESRAEVLKNDVDNIYRALHTKLGKSPGTLDQVPQSILDIPISEPPTQEPLTITPSVDRQEFYTSDEKKYNPITVEPVTSAIDSNIQSENIKAGISILGVFGTLSGGTSNDFVVPNGMKFALSTFTNFPTNCDLSYVTDMSRMFSSCSQLTTIPQLNTSRATDMSYMFNECYSLTTIPQLDTSGVTNMSSMFSSCSQLTTIPQLNTSRATDMNSVFNGCSSLTTIPQLDTSNVTNMNSMFNSCSSLTTIPQLNTSNVTDMESMFTYCSSLTSIPLLNTSNVQYMGKMFSGCNSLTTIPQLDTSNVTSMYGMFTDCANLTTIPLLNTSNVQYMDEMFSGCNSLTTIPQLDTSNVTSMYGMFTNCANLTTIPQLNTSKVEYMDNMFSWCDNLTTIEGIDFSGLTKDLNNLFGMSSSKENIGRFIVNGKINVSIGEYSIDALTSIDYDSVKSILAAADRTDNTNEKTLVFNITMTDQNGELAALVSSCTSKGWTISGLTLQ